MIASGTVAAFAANIPFSDLFGVNVVLDGMATVAQRARRTLKIVRRIESGPPVGTIRDKIGAPSFGGGHPIARAGENNHHQLW
jgi:hypothetical protein